MNALVLLGTVGLGLFIIGGIAMVIAMLAAAHDADVAERVAKAHPEYQRYLRSRDEEYHDAND